MNNHRLMTTGWDEENPIVGRCDPPDPYHLTACGPLDTVRRRQSAAPVRFAHEALQERQDGPLDHSGKSAVGVDAMPVAADPDTTLGLHGPGPNNDRRRQLELDLYLADTRPHVHPIADGLEIEPERRLADQLAQRVESNGGQRWAVIHLHLLYPPPGQDQQHYGHHRQEDESTSGSAPCNRRPQPFGEEAGSVHGHDAPPSHAAASRSTSPAPTVSRTSPGRTISSTCASA